MQTLNIIYAKRNQLKSIKILNLRVCLVFFPPHLQPHLFLLQYLSFLNLRTNDGLNHLFLCSCLQQFADYFSSRLARPLGSIDIKQCEFIKVFDKPCFALFRFPFHFMIYCRLDHAGSDRLFHFCSFDIFWRGMNLLLHRIQIHHHKGKGVQFIQPDVFIFRLLLFEIFQ